MLPGAVMLYGDDAHYSLPKAARILRIPAVPVKNLPNGEIDLADFALQLALRGAHDDIAGALQALPHCAGWGPKCCATRIR